MSESCASGALGVTRRRRRAAGLRHMRGLTGSGLTLDELSALSAPWFMDRAYADRYTARDLRQQPRTGRRGSARARRSSAQPAIRRWTADAEAPFCALQLHEASSPSYRSWPRSSSGRCDRRGLLVAKGGSFGFRGHRFELIEPEPGQGRTFLRVAMGWRGGHSSRGLCELFGELAPSSSSSSAARAGS